MESLFYLYRRFKEDEMFRAEITDVLQCLVVCGIVIFVAFGTM